MIRAAGGVVHRRGEHGQEVLLVHRPKYDDWSFPKGKADDGEDDLACALREVEEETGLRCVPEHELGSTLYRDNRGRRKVVRYWSMEPQDGGFTPGEEVDEIAWLDPDVAEQRLTYGHDRAILSQWQKE
ncbi:MAG: 8-oxo-dGTP diphosphatase [Actinomycetota bacterium]|nr:8-oxo-dGTP diphosphatase [Actinomycetota bacterium]